MNFYLSILQHSKDFSALSQGVSAGRAPLAVTGLSGVHKAHFAAALCLSLKRKALFLLPDETECARMQGDLRQMGINAVQFPARTLSLRAVEGASREYELARLGVLARMMRGEYDIVLCTADAALLSTIPPDVLKANTRSLSAGMELPLEKAARDLVAAGYTRAGQVDGVGQFSIRGGILDFYPAGAEAPVRAELWGDEIDTLYAFDLQTQRRTEPVNQVWLPPVSETLVPDLQALAGRIDALAQSLRGKSGVKAAQKLYESSDTLKNGCIPANMDKFLPLLYPQPASLFDYLPEDGLVLVSETARIKERVRTTLWQHHEDVESLLEEGELCKGLEGYYQDESALIGILEQHRAVYFDTFARSVYPTAVGTLLSVDARQLSVWSGARQPLLEDLHSMMERKMAAAVLCPTERAAKTLAQDLSGEGFSAAYESSPQVPQPGHIVVFPGSLTAGFEYPSAGFGLITQGHIQAAGKKRKAKRPKDAAAVHSLSELAPGDYVVHTAHGIGVFEGIHKLEMDGIVKDYIKIRYSKGDMLYVPVTQLDLVSKYIGPREDAKVKLHRLGGTEWQKTRQRVRSAVKDMAKELTLLYARRMQEKGYAFSPDGEWQDDFEAHFDYEETDDQLRCIEEIKADMERPIPMDRLLCGDVGFGKTEVALRAAFKCVTDGKQCALLAPTTLLAWQHFQTIERRFEGFPIRVEVLSRYRTPKQQEKILAKLARGEIDLIVGTHRLVQKDVRFRDLGLLIVDEEQRFGVAQKEKLKETFAGVDCLTLSATPIPRTLNMALSGIRDMSVLEEAPQDRHPVQTYVLEHDDGVLADAIRRELRRGGQVYYIHNRVESIEHRAAQIHARVPEARIAVAHGRMNEEELSEVWRQLLEQEIDVLVCTTIVETGVDVSNVNTLIIENADHMGLSQLHQLRGRVGRSSRRAFAYLTFIRGKVLTEISTKRLAAIREYTEFGSGFKIAMRDLEIRGAGSLLGAQQHGHMESVGYEMYLRLLSEAVSEEKGEAPERREAECAVDIQA
ncbi:MAG: transcription-repair coupling factor, partial [Clostridiales bacterium]|nr:transcription-repair coupling factor [Clostridiales bacterium]